MYKRPHWCVSPCTPYAKRYFTIFPSRENQNKNKKKLQIKALSVFHLRNINGTNIYCIPEKDR